MSDSTETDVNWETQSEFKTRSNGTDRVNPKKCAYCKIDNTSTLVMCTEDGKWFCNGKGHTSYSHIIHHLVRARHNEIKLHPHSPMSNMTLECENCYSTNVFQLGFINSNDKVLMCRHPCALMDTRWDPKLWEPLISDCQLLSWVMKVPTEKDYSKARKVTSNHINNLEKLWIHEPNATMENIFCQSYTPAEIMLRYEDADTYNDVFAGLIQLESDENERSTESIKFNDVMVRWKLGINNKQQVYFNLSKTKAELKLAIGNQLKLTYEGDSNIEWSDIGNIIKLPNDESNEVGVSFENSPNSFPVEETTNFHVEYVWHSIPYDRMQNALDKFLIDGNSMLPYISYKILGQEPNEILTNYQIPPNISAPGLPELNVSQILAVRTVMQRPLSLIQGPPGTGKTVTSATIVYHLANKTKNKEKVLVCAPSNIAVDQLAEKIHKTGVEVVRVYSKSKEMQESPISELDLQSQILKLDGSGELNMLQNLKDKNGELNELYEKRYLELKKRLEREVLQSAIVICCTCMGAGDERITSFRFRSVLIDESTQATEPECLIPMVLGCCQVVLVGDHCQLRPIIMCKKAEKAGFTLSLFERLVLLGNNPIMLEIQYRMHPALSEFPSKMFYEGNLKNGVSAEQRLERTQFPWPNPAKPLFFYCSFGDEEIASDGLSRLNCMEAVAITSFVKSFITNGVDASNIGIVTPYEGQRAYLVDYLRYSDELPRNTYKKIEVASVDAFQGREKDYILLTCVRSNKYNNIGFIKDHRRLNVAITRARYGQIIIGNPITLWKDPLYNKLLHSYQKHGLLVEGPIDNLRQSFLKLPAETNAVNGIRSGATFTLQEYRNVPIVNINNAYRIPNTDYDLHPSDYEY